MKFAGAAAVAVVVLLGACGARTQAASFIHAAPSPPDQPIKFFSTKQPACEYEELGIVRGYADTGFTKLQRVLDEMAVEARRMGGHAIVGIAQSRVAGDGDTKGDSDSGLFGTVIRFKAQDCTS